MLQSTPLAAMEAWNWMGGAVDWSALETVAVLVGAEDEWERWLGALTVIRDYRRPSDDHSPT